MALDKIFFHAIKKEREKQDKKWGYPQVHTLPEWMMILAEERGEADAEANEVHFRDKQEYDLIEELVHEAAVVMAIYESIYERRIVKKDRL